jgi:hypothetical protein
VVLLTGGRFRRPVAAGGADGVLPVVLTCNVLVASPARPDRCITFVADISPPVTLLQRT